MKHYMQGDCRIYGLPRSKVDGEPCAVKVARTVRWGANGTPRPSGQGSRDLPNAENTDVEAVKGGLSTSMRRAAVQWGVGRYLYRIPNQWVPVDQHGRLSQKPKIPSEFLPPRSGRARGGQASANRSRAASQSSSSNRNGNSRTARPEADQYRMGG